MGTNSRIPAGLIGLLAGEPENGSLDSHVIQPYFTGLIARAAGMTVKVEAIDGGARLAATTA